LVQGVCEHALRVAERFEFRGDERFVAWLLEIGRQHLADRHRYWSALKRGSARVLRLTWTGLEDGAGKERVPSSTATGPATYAARREQLAFAARALALLSERDRKLVRWLSEGVPVDEQAQRLELSADSVRRASSRALERFRKTFAAIGGPGGATRGG
jgi:DNA-directed RNA polymerase specialized sigma24 family protein